MLCGISTSLDELVFFRVLQGLCGGGLIATGQAIMRDTFPAKQLGLSQALTSIGAIIGPSIGPTLGGILTDQLSWNWIFYINIVPGHRRGDPVRDAAARSGAQRPPERRRRRVSAFMAIGLGCLQYVLDEGERYDWFGDQNIYDHRRRRCRCRSLRSRIGSCASSRTRSWTCAFCSTTGSSPRAV